MGYTHYWYVNTEDDRRREAFGRTALDAKHLFAIAAEAGYDLAGPMGDGEPELSEGRIAFNGRDPDQSYESFALEADPDATPWTHAGFRWAFACTKIGFMDPAGFRAYGDVIEALLIRAKVHYGDALRVSSDGEWDSLEAWGNWRKGRELYQLAFGEPAVCPFDEGE